MKIIHFYIASLAVLVISLVPQLGSDSLRNSIVAIFYTYAFISLTAFYFLLKNMRIEFPLKEGDITKIFKSWYFKVQGAFMIIIVVALFVLLLNPSEKKQLYYELTDITISKIKSERESIDKFGVIMDYTIPLKETDVIRSSEKGSKIIEIRFSVEGSILSRYVVSKLRFNENDQKWELLDYQILRKDGEWPDDF